jgi:hypothetical protein
VDSGNLLLAYTSRQLSADSGTAVLIPVIAILHLKFINIIAEPFGISTMICCYSGNVFMRSTETIYKIFPHLFLFIF